MEGQQHYQLADGTALCDVLMCLIITPYFRFALCVQFIKLGNLYT